jgi:CRISPR type III-A-associated protein Csm2
LASKPAGEPAGGSAAEPARKAPNKELFDAIARDYASHIRKGGLSDNTQLRRWFNAVDELNNKAVRGVLSPEHIQAEMALLRARIAYASQRPGVKVPRALVDFVTIGSKKINDADDLLVFRCLFECVVAYHRARQPNQEGEQ